MDHENRDIPDDLIEVESALGQLLPNTGRLSSDRLLYEAGALSARRSRSAQVLPWAVAAGSLVVALISSAVFITEREHSKRLETLVVSQTQRLDVLEARTQSIATTVEALPSHSDSLLRLRAQWVSDGVLTSPSAEDPSTKQASKNVSRPLTPTSLRRRSPVDL